MLEAVAVSWSAAERYATNAEVIWLVVNTSWSRARPVGQQRARDGGLRLRVLRARRAVVSRQGVHLRRGVVGQQCARDGAGRLRVLRRSGAVVSQQRVYLRRGVVGQQGCCYGGVSARRGVAVCRDAQRVVAVGQRSRERSHEVQVANDAASAKELPSCEARQAGALTTPLPESCRAASSARIASRALWSAVSLARQQHPAQVGCGHKLRPRRLPLESRRPPLAWWLPHLRGQQRTVCWITLPATRHDRRTLCLWDHTCQHAGHLHC